MSRSIFCRRRSYGSLPMRIAGTVAPSAVAAGVIVNFKSNRRYIRISLMELSS
jgi:hypothetical protein